MKYFGNGVLKSTFEGVFEGVLLGTLGGAFMSSLILFGINQGIRIKEEEIRKEQNKK